MTVRVLGDAHAEESNRREALLAAYDAADADVALQAGDLGYYDPPIPTWFVAGNNEDFDVIEALRRGDRSTVGDDLHLLDSTVAEVAGLRVAGLSGNYAPTRYDEPRAALSGDRRRHFVREDVELALDLGPVDVLLAHEAPHGLLSFGYDPGNEHVDALIDALSPDLCLVGHYHRYATMERCDTRVVSLAPAWEHYCTLDPASLELARHPTPIVKSDREPIQAPSVSP